MNDAAANLKSAKAQRKIERKLTRAGDAEGRAEFQRQKGDEAARKYNDSAKAFEKSAKQLDKEGKHIRADAARKVAEALRDKGSKARAEYDAAAEDYLSYSKALTQSANKYATKKNVDMGKMRVDSILKASKEKGYTDEKEWDEVFEKMERDN